MCMIYPTRRKSFIWICAMLNRNSFPVKFIRTIRNILHFRWKFWLFRCHNWHRSQ